MRDVELIEAAARLARGAPTDWDKFVRALQNYSHETMKQCIQSPLAELPRSQGHAQGVARLVDILGTSVRRADAIESKRK